MSGKVITPTTNLGHKIDPTYRPTFNTTNFNLLRFGALSYAIQRNRMGTQITYDNKHLYRTPTGIQSYNFGKITTHDTATKQKEEFEIHASMVTIAYKRSDTTPGQWVPTRITLEEFQEHFGNNRQEAVSKMKDTATYGYTGMIDTDNEDEVLHVHHNDNEFEWKLQEIGAKIKTLEKNDIYERERVRDEPNEILTRNINLRSNGKNLYEATGNCRLAIVRNIPFLQPIEHLTGSNYYDSWATKLRRYFAAFDVME